MDKIGYARVFLRAGGLGEAFARISSRWVWTKPGAKVDKNECMVDKIGHFPNLLDIDGHTYRGVLRSKSGIPLMPLLKHSRSPVIHVLKKYMDEGVLERPYARRRAKKKFSLVDPDVTGPFRT